MSNTLWVAFGALIVIGLVFWFQRAEISHLDTRIEDLVAENATLTAANQAFVLSVKNQDAAVATLQAQAAAREKATSIAIAEAGKRSRQYELRARNIAAETTTGDECQDARAIVNDYFVGIQP